ncbi:hypothetical protein llap_14039 [Limosa lapponica baueri]|uniref:Uncharacterized protein n=1 Tax=Limosa lapponica baueri TaxID=1758121 RepID=A0A2I0TPC7_LIMLA|nr:hypothetical protein llap_14039 [Limosa lapponica baueri]
MRSCSVQLLWYCGLQRQFVQPACGLILHIGSGRRLDTEDMDCEPDDWCGSSPAASSGSASFSFLGSSEESVAIERKPGHPQFVQYESWLVNFVILFPYWIANVSFWVTAGSKARFMTDAARREQESLKKKIQPKLSLTLSSTVSRGNVSTPPRHSSGSLTPPVTPPITPSSSFRSSTPTGSEYDEEEVDYEESDSDESWTTESAISSEAILSSMCMNGGDEKPFACPVPGCKKRYKLQEKLTTTSRAEGKMFSDYLQALLRIHTHVIQD